MQINTVINNDNLIAMSAIPAGAADLVYMDPPFNTGRDYVDFDDRFNSTADFVGFIAERLVEIKRILKDGGAFYLHADEHAIHYLKVECDRIFGEKRFQNHIVWKRATAVHGHVKRFGPDIDHILYYGGHIDQDAVRPPLDPDYVRQHFRHEDSRGRYQTYSLTAETLGSDPNQNVYEYRGYKRKWKVSEQRMHELEADGRIHFSERGGMPRRKAYLADAKGRAVGSLWTDIPPMASSSNERVGYRTQKPLALLDRIIRASSTEGDLVMDPFCGSGTTLVAAKLLNRNYLGIDRNPKAVEIAERRLAAAGTEPGGLFDRRA